MRLIPALRFLLVGLIWLLFSGLGCIGSAQAQRPASPILLDDKFSSITPWPSIRVLVDNDNSMNIDKAMRSLDRFAAPPSDHASLGKQESAVWLHIPIETAKGSDGEWIWDVDYHALNRLDLYLTQNGLIKQSVSVGNFRPLEARPLLSRSYAMPMDLAPGQGFDLIARVETQGGMVLPITLFKPQAFHARAVEEQLLQGLMIGIGLCLLIYSLAQWVVLRESLFISYAVLTFGSLLFSVFLFGTGSQFLWTNNLWMERHIGVLAAVCALVGSYLFYEQSLRSGQEITWYRRIMTAGAMLSAMLGFLFMLDVINAHTMTTLISLLSPIPSLLSIPGAVDRVRHRDPVGLGLLIGWLAYFVTSSILIAVLAGKLPVNFGTLHAFEFGALIDMLAFMYVLSLRTRAIRLAATRASQERDIMRLLALTDPLTGLANRRSLFETLEQVVPLCREDHMLALYVIDVDGFKPVNDRFGHDAGDELLVGIARRLKEHVRASDVVARFGGDEFVIMAEGMHQPQQAQQLGHKLLDAFKTPFMLKQGEARIGLTIGYSLGPIDAKDPNSLFKAADEAMYAGKQAGKNCVRRATVEQHLSKPFQVQTS